MKQLVILIFMVLAKNISSAQIPDYFANNPEWRIDASGDPPCIYHDEKVFFVVGDSIVDDVSYKVFNYRVYTTYSQQGPWPTGCPGPMFGEGFHGLYRQDERSIFKLEGGNESEIANYNYQVGDSIFQYGSFTGGIVNSVSVEQIGGQERLQFWYSDSMLGGEHSFIEGVSSISLHSGELFSTYAPIYVSMYNPLYICYSQNGETVHENPNNWEGECYFNVSIVENESIKLGALPNPFQNEVFITSNRNGLFKILNSSGQEVINGKLLKGEQTLSTFSLAKGVYFLQVSTEQGEMTTHRMVKM